MPSFECTIDLPASPEASWAFVVEHGNEIESFSFDGQDVQAAGTLNHLTARVLGLSIRAVSRTVVWEPPSRCDFESVKPAWPVRTFISERFEASNSGTRHSIRYDVAPRGPVGRIVAPCICWLMRRSRQHYQQRLQAALSRGAAR